MRNWLRNWYDGTTEIQEFDNDPRSHVVIMPVIYTNHHWTARLVRGVVKFYRAHWQFVWGTIIGVASLAVGILSLM